MESHKVLDNSFLSSQVHLTNHITHLNYQACLDIATAMSAYNEFMTVARELMEADDISFMEILRSWSELDMMCDELFCKLKKEAVERMMKDDEDDIKDSNGVSDGFRDAYDDLTIFEHFDEK